MPDPSARPSAAPAADDDSAAAAPAAGEDDTTAAGQDAPTDAPRKPVRQPPGEIGGPQGPEPTRYGDWEVKGRCSDF